jgi:hypothetical protein
MYDDGWWLIKRGVKTGLVPANYLELNESLKVDSVDSNPPPSKTNEPQRRGKNVKNNNKSRKDNSTDELVELKTLREEAEEKINALRLVSIPFHSRKVHVYI